MPSRPCAARDADRNRNEGTAISSPNNDGNAYARSTISDSIRHWYARRDTYWNVCSACNGDGHRKRDTAASDANRTTRDADTDATAPAANAAE